MATEDGLFNIITSSIITAVASSSVVSAFITHFLNRRPSKELEELRNELAIKKSKDDAHTEYEYDTKKRLYNEFESVFFHLLEISASALRFQKNIN